MSCSIGSKKIGQQCYTPSSDAHLDKDSFEVQKLIEILQRQNQQLHQEKEMMKSQWDLLSECCTELGLSDRIQEHMRRKASQIAPVYPLPAKTRRDPATSTDSFICGSARFHEVAAAASSYEAQLARKSYRRRNILQAEEARLIQQFDIFGNLRSPVSPLSSPQSAFNYTQDAMDQFLTRGESYTSAFRLP
uniref:Uncharacterized protein AlNc14C372G11112 n=1 Tax=Albugo laibachii Nc14 TaxID=890382 RepID=F0WY52_9STRA|nr:hypothetical protein PITG_02209 [Albugo laibachii Nc14]|eukprot:CCA26403.1 hypothetical protein PITG_02209 [Albugo laibachii Nc14]